MLEFYEMDSIAASRDSFSDLRFGDRPTLACKSLYDTLRKFLPRRGYEYMLAF